MYPASYKYTKSHEWIKVEGNKAKVGITAFAIAELTDLTFLQFDIEEGATLNQGDTFGEVESVKTTSALYVPVAGKVMAVNSEIADNLELMMKDPYEAGWLLEIELSDPAQADMLLSCADYEKIAVSEH